MGEAVLTIEPRPLAERLRIRKGQVVRATIGNARQDYVVTYVTMPDSLGRCDVRLAPVEA